MVKTQKNVEASRDITDAPLTATGEAVHQLSSQLNVMGERMGVQPYFELIVDKVAKYTSYLDLPYTHSKSYRTSFVSCKRSVYSAFSSLSSAFVPPSFFTPNYLAAIVVFHTAEEIQRGSRLTPAITVGFEATYNEVQIFLEVTVLDEVISVGSGIQLNSNSPITMSISPFLCIIPMKIEQQLWLDNYLKRSWPLVLIACHTLN